MDVKIIIKKDAYHDSVALMSLSGKLTAIAGVSDAVVSMATDMNKDLLRRIGIYTTAVDAAGANDLMIAVRAENETICAEAVQLAEESLAKKSGARKGSGEVQPASVMSAVKLMPEANLAIISVPGQYAAREAMQALKNGLHVMMFSDNVSVEEEIALKKYAHQQELLMMGPDCGTAIINNVGLCFANVVRQGNIGIVGASGTGTQEVSVLIDRMGGGVSQVIGTGGRDLSEAVGGITMLDGLAALARHEATEVIVLISKPPAESVANKILDKVKGIAKPVVICFINGDAAQVEKAGAYFGKNLEATAQMAVALSKGEKPASCCSEDGGLGELAASKTAKLAPTQQYIRGLFCGGTLCDEAMHIAKASGLKTYSNIAKKAEDKLEDPHTSKAHTFIDLGDDVFTQGKPHPMIEPSLRLPRLLKEAADPETAVILMDFELGYGSHPDPVGITLPAIMEAKRAAQDAGRHLEIIGYVCGTEQDIQGRIRQEQKLAAAGVTLAKSNTQAARLAGLIAARREEKK
ncbi:acyl-CoA synthetase FdrA [Sporomusa sp.]|uniref:acyl-CoA synthetase FdrA n=1 Tax=Sporomusa sp. TaxID=2078658 RepID=UPI002B8AE4EE|nr:acyl-CoA synthetase FdrA [Sporomusa sp.]HWR45981.1 acyl-CoA synthetase FdrA [Sporomusa sp.]